MVAVVGNAHMPGIQRMWRSGEWRPMLVDALTVPGSAAAAPSPPSFFQDVEEEQAPSPAPSFFQDVEDEPPSNAPSSAGAAQPNAGVKVGAGSPHCPSAHALECYL